jgi:hypothetical protein
MISKWSRDNHGYFNVRGFDMELYANETTREYARLLQYKTCAFAVTPAGIDDILGTWAWYIGTEDIADLIDSVVNMGTDFNRDGGLVGAGSMSCTKRESHVPVRWYIMHSI